MSLYAQKTFSPCLLVPCMDLQVTCLVKARKKLMGKLEWNEELSGDVYSEESCRNNLWMRQKSNHISAWQALDSRSSCRNLGRRWKACVWFPGGSVCLMVLALFRPDEGVWSGRVRRGLRSVGKQRAWHSMCGQLLDIAKGRLSRYCTGCGHHSAPLKLTRKSPGGFVPSWHQICFHRGKLHRQGRKMRR